MSLDNSVEQIKKRIQSGEYDEPEAPEDIEYLLNKIWLLEQERENSRENEDMYFSMYLN